MFNWIWLLIHVYIQNERLYKRTTLHLIQWCENLILDMARMGFPYQCIIKYYRYIHWWRAWGGSLPNNSYKFENQYIYGFFLLKYPWSKKNGPAFQLFLKYIIKQMQALGYNCGQDISSNWYIHLIQKVSDAPEFCLFVKRNLTFFWIVLYL